MPWRTLYSSSVSVFPLGGLGMMSPSSPPPMPSRPRRSTGTNPGESPTPAAGSGALASEGVTPGRSTACARFNAASFAAAATE